MNGIAWDINPIIISFGPFELRYYSLLFAIAIIGGFYLLQRKLVQDGYTKEFSDTFLLYGVLGVVIGARLGHCFFYDKGNFYLNNPLEILKIWKGGLASHGATIGLFIAAVLFSKRKKIPFLVLSDAIVFAAAVGATLVRIGNFFNSEIVGRQTTLPWGIRFIGYDQGTTLRHPSQLYEALGGLTVLMTLLLLQKYVKKAKPGLFLGTFLIMYFSFRFMVEFVKEYQILESFLTMGQWLSIPFVLMGIVILYRSVKGASMLNHRE
jgi:phosphatidylglycerol---prolipoprotein diacylglyceryl transferase